MEQDEGWEGPGGVLRWMTMGVRRAPGLPTSGLAWGAPWRGGDRGSPQTSPRLRGPSLSQSSQGQAGTRKGAGASRRPGALVWEGASDELILW